MSYTVTLYFDNMVDETHFFKKEGDAAKCKAQLESKYRGDRMYKVKMEELEDAFEYVWEVATGELREWFRKLENRNNFARAWLDGYEVEEEKRYFVKVKATKHYISKDGIGKIFFSLAYKESFTKKELEDAGFGWVFDCPGIEIEEVE